MGMPRSWAKIEFPYAMIDTDIRKYLEGEGVRFKEADPRELEHSLELAAPLYDLETENTEGIFTFENSEAQAGEFEDLEIMLVKKGIPFDRETGLDWNCPPVRRIFRPAENTIASDRCWHEPLDLTISLNDDGEPVVSVAAIRRCMETSNTTKGGAIAIKEYLDHHFPAYAPLADFVKAGVAKA